MHGKLVKEAGERMGKEGGRMEAIFYAEGLRRRGGGASFVFGLGR